VVDSGNEKRGEDSEALSPLIFKESNGSSFFNTSTMAIRRSKSIHMDLLLTSENSS